MESPLNNQSLVISNYDLIHYPFFDPFFLTLPQKSTKPFIVTVHDIIPIQYIRHFYPGIKGYIRWLIQKSRLLKAKYLLTVSHTSKFAVNKYTQFPLDRIYTTYEASPPEYFPLHDKKYLTKIKRKYLFQIYFYQ